MSRTEFAFGPTQINKSTPVDSDDERFWPFLIIISARPISTVSGFQVKIRFSLQTIIKKAAIRNKLIDADCIARSYSVIVRVRVVLKRAVVGTNVLTTFVEVIFRVK